MRIIVVNDDGNQETLELPNGTTWKVSDGPAGIMDCLQGTRSFDYYFNENGSYDGWGGGLSCSLGQDESREIIQAQEDAIRYISAGGRRS